MFSMKKIGTSICSYFAKRTEIDEGSDLTAALLCKAARSDECDTGPQLDFQRKKPSSPTRPSVSREQAHKAASGKARGTCLGVKGGQDEVMHTGLMPLERPEWDVVGMQRVQQTAPQPQHSSSRLQEKLGARILPQQRQAVHRQHKQMLLLGTCTPIDPEVPLPGEQEHRQQQQGQQQQQPVASSSQSASGGVPKSDAVDDGLAQVAPTAPTVAVGAGSSRCWCHALEVKPLEDGIIPGTNCRPEQLGCDDWLQEVKVGWATVVQLPQQQEVKLNCWMQLRGCSRSASEGSSLFCLRVRHLQATVDQYQRQQAPAVAHSGSTGTRRRRNISCCWGGAAAGPTDKRTVPFLERVHLSVLAETTQQNFTSAVDPVCDWPPMVAAIDNEVLETGVCAKVPCALIRDVNLWGIIQAGANPSGLVPVEANRKMAPLPGLSLGQQDISLVYLRKSLIPI